MKLPASWLALALSVCACAQAAEPARQVNLYIWNEYLAPDTLSSFEQKTGIKVVVDHFDSLETVETKLLTGRSGYDLVLTAGQHLQRAIQSGALQPLDKAALQHFAGIGQEFARHMAAFDPGNRYAGIYLWGTTGFGYQQEAIAKRMPEAPVDSWAMLLDPQVVAKFADCGVSYLNDPNEVFAAAFRYLGLDINKQNLDDLKKVEAHLAQVRPHIRYFDNDRNIADLANGDTCLAMSWNGNVGIAAGQAQQAGKPYSLSYSIPREGALIWFDAMVIPKDAPHPEAALALMDHLMTPEVIGAITNTVFYANAVPAADKTVDPAILADPGTYPPAEVRATLYTKNDNGKAFNRALTRAFSRFKSGT
ncbi:putative spermidine/putrescine transport system substrate-binding protein/putrescine transport system substrate-binding protein [Pseudomonas fluvialis]|uniref:Putative spermidine/putrescine transport system substrate-binding protein/putrescine transport system substrate-binding protein n=1 Tax=Pseudomonas fluvialis TaxID=1793966 RepID=A0A7X0BRI2_9PSED|nr:extracellular solute-binding protein [Pseudomonas fluvialis]MBB6341263.1 putative spermidine/putrescine transport system substrate-binding protein/putrescine transport system substrate-binding protein [Pseudomonas fluvialis]